MAIFSANEIRTFFLKVLIHSPGMLPNYKGDLTKTLSEDDLKKLPNTPETYQEARISMWEALQDLKKQGRIRGMYLLMSLLS